MIWGSLGKHGTKQWQNYHKNSDNKELGPMKNLLHEINCRQIKLTVDLPFKRRNDFITIILAGRMRRPRKTYLEDVE